MSTKPVAVIAEVVFKDDAITQGKKLFAEVIAQSRKDEGCLYYDAYADPENPNHFLLIERWASKALWEAHMPTAHVLDFMAAAGPLLAEPPRVRYFTEVED